jgi:hypothetical protein
MQESKRGHLKVVEGLAGQHSAAEQSFQVEKYEIIYK